MGFAREAARVRDESLPLSMRYTALGYWIIRAHPLGLRPTWTYLEEKLDVPWHRPEFLMQAIDLLEAECEVHLGIEATYSSARRSLNAAGFRSRPLDEVRPVEPRRWHGDERVGARHVLDAWRKESRLDLTDPTRRRIFETVEHVLSGATLTDEVAEELQRMLTTVRAGGGYIVGDGRGLDEVSSYLRPLSQLFLLIHEVPGVGESWNFVAPESKQGAR